MRIISGKLKGRRITAPKNLPTRPTTDMAKEALFNILNNHYYFDEISVLDLFSGIGSISLEFASRGAKQITSVDKHPVCIKFLDQTARELAVDINTVKLDVFKFLGQVNTKFDVVFADPPYHFTDEQYLQIYNEIFDNELLNEQGMLILEHSKNTELEHLKHFTNKKRYGGSYFSFFEKE